jgi:sortase (surface protein transpeptidase)
MRLLRPKSLIWILLFLIFALYLFITFPYLRSLSKYSALSTSGLVYSLKGRADITRETTVIKPVSTRFGLVITKLGLNKRIVKEVDFYDPLKLESSLRRGLAQVSISSLPGHFGTVLIVGHPLSTFLNLDHLNPEFYLISKLEVGDEMSVFYNDIEFVYKVVQKRFESPTYLDFFDPGRERKLMLVSGYPPGMALKFLVIEAEEVD